MVVEGGKITLDGVFLYALSFHRTTLGSIPVPRLSVSTCYTLERLFSCAVGFFPHSPSIDGNCIFLTPQKMS